MLTLCRPRGEPCSSGGNCCGLVCSTGYCAALNWCLPTFEPCETDIECCSGKCERDVSGFKRCLPIGGCRTSGPVLTTKGPLNQFGEICRGNHDCCSSSCQTDTEGVARCKKRGDPTSSATNPVCLPEGELCETDQECCAAADGGAPRCDRPPAPPGETAYPKRCLTGGTACRPNGAQCADPTQCCGGTCQLHPDLIFRCGVPPPPPDGGPRLPDGGAPPDAGLQLDGGSNCTGYGLGCTTSRDCCQGQGLQCVPDGSGGLVCGFIIN